MENNSKPYFTKQNLRLLCRKNLETWNKCIEDVIYIKHLILACNGKTIKKHDAENYKSRTQGLSFLHKDISPSLNDLEDFEDIQKDEKLVLSHNLRKKDFDLCNMNECRKIFKPSEIIDKQYIKGEIHIELFKPLLVKQHFFIKDANNNLKKDTIREINYNNMFDLCLPEEYLIGQEGSRTINLKFIDWKRDFWVHLFPSFYIDRIDIRTVNNLIALYSEIIRTKGQIKSKDKINDNNLWTELDTITSEIQNFKLTDNYFDLSNDDVYFTMSKLLSGNPKFYYNTVREIKQPLLKIKFNSLIDGIQWSFNNFTQKHYHEIKSLVFNFLEDPIGIDISLNSKSTFFTEPDTKIDLLIKIFDAIINHSKKDNYYLKLSKIIDLYFVISKLPDKQLKSVSELDKFEPFRILRKNQSTLLKTFGLCILTELYYSDKIKVINGQFLDSDIYNMYDKLILTAVKCLENGFNGMNNIEGTELFEFCGLIKVREHKPYIKNRFISYYFVEQYIEEQSFRDEFLKTAYIHDLIIPRNKKEFPKTINLCRNLKKNYYKK